MSCDCKNCPDCAEELAELAKLIDSPPEPIKELRPSTRPIVDLSAEDLAAVRKLK